MVPVQQSKTGHRRGDCFAACLASIFEVKIEDVPEFTEELWHVQLTEWLSGRGMSFAYIHAERGVTPPKGYSIASTEFEMTDGKRGTHCVVALDGRVAWDPFPGKSAALLASSYSFISHWLVFTALDAAKLVKKQ